MANKIVVVLIQSDPLHFLHPKPLLVHKLISQYCSSLMALDFMSGRFLLEMIEGIPRIRFSAASAS